MLAPLVALDIFYGVRPGVILDAFAAPTEALLQIDRACARRRAKAAALWHREAGTVRL